MKKYFKYILAVAAVAFAVSACKKSEEYNAGDPDVDGCYGVYFPTQDASGSHIYSPEMETSVDITVMRKVSKGAIDVPFEISDPDGAFSVGKIQFNDGQSETTLHVSFDGAQLGSSASVSFSITDPQYASKYSEYATNFDFGYNRVEIKQFFGPKATAEDEGTLDMPAWEESATGKLYYYDTAFDNIRYCYIEDAPYTGHNYEFYWNTETNYLFVPLQGFYQRSNGTYAAMSDAFGFYNGYYSYGYTCPSKAYFDKDISFNANNGFFQPYYDGNGGFYLGDWCYIIDGDTPTGSGWQWGGDSELDADLFIAPGFTRVDYTLEVESDYSVEGVLPVYFTTGADVKEILVAGFEGELSKVGIENAVASILDGSVASESISTADFEEEAPYFYGSAELSFEKSGTYTVVAVGLDKNGDDQSSASVVAPYVAASTEDQDAAAVLVNVGAEEISDRYAPDYTATNAFGYYITGTDLTAVNYAIVKTSSYKAYKSNYDALIKAGETGVNVLDEDEIATVNAAGGLATIATGLSALTSYTVVVWATNGKLDKIATAEYTTDGLPNEVVVDGTAAYEYTVAFSGWDEGLNLEYNPNTSMYEIPNWCYGVTFKFSYDKETGKITVPQQTTGYTHSSYGTFYIMQPTDLPESWISYFGIDTEPESYVDEDGNFHFYLSYITSANYYFGTDYELFCPAGAIEDEEESNVTVHSAKVSATLHGKLGKSLQFVDFGKVSYNRSASAAKMSIVKVGTKRIADSKDEISEFKPSKMAF